MEFVAVTHDGRRIARSRWSRTGQRGTESLRFEYPVPLAQVRAFDKRTRATRVFLYEEVALLPPPEDSPKADSDGSIPHGDEAGTEARLIPDAQTARQ